MQHTAPETEKKTGRFRLTWASHQQRWFGKWHLYLGILAGAIVAVVGLTGSILVFQDEIDEALNPELFRVMQQQKRISLTDIVPVLQQKYPHLHFDYIMKDLADRPNQAYRLYNFNTGEEYFVDPYTAVLSGKRLHESSFIEIVTEIHRSLLVPVVGRYIVGLATLGLLILTITGLRLWIPAKWKQLKTVLTVKFSAGFKRQNYDWHNVLGFYSAPAVVMLAVTGVCITFQPLVVGFIFLLNGQSPQGVAQLLGAPSAYHQGAATLSPAALEANAKLLLPDGIIEGIALPADSVANYRLDILAPGLPRSGKREMLLFDQYSGKNLLNSRTDFPASGHAYLSWLTPLHFGNFGGRPTQVIALIGALMPLLLFITGFIIWWPRYRKQKEQQKKGKLLRTSRTTQTIKPFFPEWKKGLRYAGWLLLCTLVMGALYGLASGLVWQPAVIHVVFVTTLVLGNGLMALLLLVPNLLFTLFGKGSRLVNRYAAWSIAMALVFTSAYLLLMNTGIIHF